MEIRTRHSIWIWSHKLQAMKSLCFSLDFLVWVRTDKMHTLIICNNWTNVKEKGYLLPVTKLLMQRRLQSWEWLYLSPLSSLVEAGVVSGWEEVCQLQPWEFGPRCPWRSSMGRHSRSHSHANRPLGWGGWFFWGGEHLPDCLIFASWWTALSCCSLIRM